MDWVIWLLFESTAALGGLLGVVLFVLLVYWRRGGRPQPLLIGAAVAVALLAVQSLVVTKREHAARILNAIQVDIIRARTDALAAALAPDFDADGLDRDEFIEMIQREMRRLEIHWVERTSLRVEDGGAGSFGATATYLAEVTLDQITSTTRSRWLFSFVRTPDGWKIVRFRPENIDGVPGPSWHNTAGW